MKLSAQIGKSIRLLHVSVSDAGRHIPNHVPSKPRSPFSRALRTHLSIKSKPARKFEYRNASLKLSITPKPKAKQPPDFCQAVWHPRTLHSPARANFPLNRPKFMFVAPCSADNVLSWSKVSTPLISEAIKKAYGFTHCNSFQSMLHKYLIPNGADAMIRSPTGSGKTLSFLIPALKHLISQSENTRKSIQGPRVLILCPTRELATQTKRTANKLAIHCLNHVRVGGIISSEHVGRNSRLSLIQTASGRNTPNLLVATPGRLLEMLLGQFPKIVIDVDMLIFDEADRMLDENFSDQVRTILDFIPQNRQTFLLSATFSEEIQTLANTILKPGYVAITTVKDSNAPTVDTVRQFYTVASMAKQPALVHTILHRAWLAHLKFARQSDPHPFKYLFSNQSLSDFKEISSIHRSGKIPDSPSVVELHSDMSKIERTRASKTFSQVESAILITTDVSARGMDYKNVGLVLQVGMPINVDSYIHRLGRSARAGEQGVGILIVSGCEQGASIQMLTAERVPIIEATCENGCIVELGNRLGDSVKWCASTSLRMIHQAVRRSAVDQALVSDAYLGQIGYYENLMPRLLKYQTSGYTLLKELDAFVSLLGLSQVPKLPQALRQTFLKPHKVLEDKRVVQLGMKVRKSRSLASCRSKSAAQKQHKHNQLKMLGMHILKSRKPMLDNKFLYRP